MSEARLADRPPPYGTVVFDCDSTLSAMEGVEELAGPEHAREIERLTEAAMDGRVPLEEVFGQRLALVRPSRADLERVGRLYIEKLVPGARELVALLKAAGKRVVIVSGGLLPAVQRLADALGVPEVHAVGVRFHPGGSFDGHDEESPLARAGGKPEVVGQIAAGPRAGAVALVGDGATDLEAAPLVARFIAYGGVVRRDAVARRAAVTCDALDLRELAPLLLSSEELTRLRQDPEYAPHLPAEA